MDGLAAAQCGLPSAMAARRQREHQRRVTSVLPKGTHLSGYSQAYLNKIALRSIQRPRKTLRFAAPADKLAQVLH